MTQYLYCHDNEVTTLQDLPNSLKELWYYDNFYNINYTCNIRYYNINTNNYNYNKQLLNLIQIEYLDSSYHPNNKFCKQKLLFRFDDLFDEY